MSTAIYVWTFLLLSCMTVNADSIAGFDEYKSERDLRKYLFHEYDKLVRPVIIPSNKINVSVGLAPLFLRKMDEKNQLIVMYSWIRLIWKDEYLKWDPNNFENVTVLRVPSTEIWRPDLAIYVAVPVENIFLNTLSQALIYYDGTILWVLPATIKTFCPLLNRAPRNTIKCNIRLGSWTYTENEMDVHLMHPEIDLRNFIDSNVEWKLIGVNASQDSKYYSCCKEAFRFLHFNVTLKRRKPLKEKELVTPEDSDPEEVELEKMKKILETN